MPPSCSPTSSRCGHPLGDSPRTAGDRADAPCPQEAAPLLQRRAACPAFARRSPPNCRSAGSRRASRLSLPAPPAHAASWALVPSLTASLPPSDVPLPAQGGSAAPGPGLPPAPLRARRGRAGGCRGRAGAGGAGRAGRAACCCPPLAAGAGQGGGSIPCWAAAAAAEGRDPRAPPPSPWAQVAGVHSQALPDLPDGTFDLDQLELTVREAHGSRYHPRPELICLENTHSSAGGRVLPLTYLQQVGAHSRPLAAALPGRRQPDPAGRHHGDARALPRSSERGSRWCLPPQGSLPAQLLLCLPLRPWAC